MSRQRDAMRARMLADRMEAAAYALPGNHRSYEAPAGANGSNYEQTVRHLVKQGVPLDVAQKTAATRAGVGKVNLPLSSPIGGNIRTAAQFALKVTRDSANIAQPLPFVLMGSLDAQSGYRQVITQDLPAGVALTSVKIGEDASKPNSAEFTYTAAGPLVDTITITCNMAPYPNIIESLITDLLLVNKLRMTLSDAAQTSQFNFALNTVTRNLFGSNFENPLAPGDYKSPEQFQQGIVDMDVDWKFDKETMVKSLILPVAGFNVNYSLFIEEFYRQSARDWAN